MVSESDHVKYGVVYSDRLACKRSVGSSKDVYIYKFQVNGLHSPDDIVAYNREIAVLIKHDVFKHPLGKTS